MQVFLSPPSPVNELDLDEEREAEERWNSVLVHKEKGRKRFKSGSAFLS